VGASSHTHSGCRRPSLGRGGGAGGLLRTAAAGPPPLLLLVLVVGCCCWVVLVDVGSTRCGIGNRCANAPVHEVQALSDGCAAAAAAAVCCCCCCWWPAGAGAAGRPKRQSSPVSSSFKAGTRPHTFLNPSKPIAAVMPPVPSVSNLWWGVQGRCGVMGVGSCVQCQQLGNQGQA